MMIMTTLTVLFLLLGGVLTLVPVVFCLDEKMPVKQFKLIFNIGLLFLYLDKKILSFP